MKKYVLIVLLVVVPKLDKSIDSQRRILTAILQNY